MITAEELTSLGLVTDGEIFDEGLHYQSWDYVEDDMYLSVCINYTDNTQIVTLNDRDLVKSINYDELSQLIGLIFSCVIYKIGNDDYLLKITRRGTGLSVFCGTKTILWAEPGKATLTETLKDQKRKISKTLNNLDKTNRASKKGLEFLLKELALNV